MGKRIFLINLTRITLLNFTFFISGICVAQQKQFIHPENKLKEKYFGILPEKHSMQEIIKLLKLKAGIFGDTLIYKTDSTLFYFRGYSDSFNPFQIDALKTEFQIRETVVINQQLKKPVDTFLVMQVIVHTDTAQEKLGLLRTELKRLHKEMLTVYQRATHKRSSRKSKDIFETYSYYQEFVRGMPMMKVGYGKKYRDPGKYNLIIETYYYYRPATISF